jgi:predicted metalloprotease with PDZ domain
MLDWRQTDKQTWRITKQSNDDVIIRYQVFSSLLNDQMADIAGPATFMYVVGHKHVPVSVEYDVPDDWDVYTGLESRRDRYVASDYDIFIDAPVFIGEMKVLEFEAGGVPHRMVFSKPDIELIDQQVISDVTDITEAAIGIFGSVPFTDYTFLIKVQSTTGSGGLEHLNSTRITVGENDFVNQVSYRRFLFVVAHEYFHAWNVKRIRPEVLGPFDYTKEVHTRLLWMAEGITDYYANLLLLRADILEPPEYYDRVSGAINTLQHQPGRHMMSAEEASWTTWLRSDNSENNSISYYTKGEIIGLLLDLEIRARTKSAKSLDDVLRYMMQNYAFKGIGFPEDGFLNAIEAVTGSDFDEVYQLLAQSRMELEYNRYLPLAGLRLEVSRQPATIYIGVEFERADGNMTRVTRIIPNSPAERAKLDGGDILVAMNGERLTFDNFRTRLRSFGIGAPIKMEVMRGERLIQLDLVPIDFQEETWTITTLPNATPEQIELRKRWLGETR